MLGLFVFRRFKLKSNHLRLKRQMDDPVICKIVLCFTFIFMYNISEIIDIVKKYNNLQQREGLNKYGDYKNCRV